MSAEIFDPYPGTVTDPYGSKVPHTGRHAQLGVKWTSKDIARDLAPHLLSLSFTDNLSGSADDLSLDLEDRDGLWSGDWRPQFGDTVEASLNAEAWFGEANDLPIGKFAHDKIALSGPPRRASLKCVSAPLATGLRRRKRTHAWSGVTLRQIAEDIAKRAGLTLMYDGTVGKSYARRQQSDKSDLEFLDELCKEVGRTVKVTEGKIAIFDEQQIDKTPSSGTIDLIGGRVLSWNFDSDDSGRYGSCHVSFFDPRTGKTHKGEFVDKSNPDGQTIELRLPITSIGEATDRAKALLRNANRFATKGTLTTVGDPGLVAGVTFDLTNALGFDGKFIITRAEHRPVGGYTCTLDVRRCLEGY
jgi:phage protein D